MHRLVRAGWVLVLPVLCGLWQGATYFGGTLAPWQPTMVDLDVYLRAAGQLLAGEPFYDEGSQLPFLYPPLAGLLAVPLSWLPLAVVQTGWVVLNVVLLLAVMHRFGLHGWRLSLLGAAVVVVVDPVTQTLAFGQLGIILLALVVLDLVPGPRLLDRLTGRGTGRRLLPEGWASGLGAALKLTPGITVPYLFLAGRRRAAAVAVGTFVGLGLLAAAVLPGSSAWFWGRLATGDSGLGGSVVYVANQSVYGSWLRVARLGPGSELVGLGLCALTAGLGVWVAVRWHRRGEVALAVCLLGVASLLASPVSWGHHFTWVVPLALVLVRLDVAAWFQVLGWVFVGWVALAPWDQLPGGGDVELEYGPLQLLLSSTTTLLGLALLLTALLLSRGRAIRADPVPRGA